MNIDWSDIVSVLVTGLVTGLTASAFTGIFIFAFQKSIERRLDRSLEQFKAGLQQETFVRQSWWELKVQAYSDIIASLVDLQYCLERWLYDFVGAESLDAESRNRLREVFVQQKEALNKAVAVGAYIVSDQTIATLEKLVSDLEREDNWGNEARTLEIHYELTKAAIAAIRKQAKRELYKPPPTEPEDS